MRLTAFVFVHPLFFLPLFRCCVRFISVFSIKNTEGIVYLRNVRYTGKKMR
ncbi:hypothetical protein CLOSTHATH_00617 [Hungatella hathewayi DSM 13479]|uniref:Uncharacterized protein n=1 Tax=Hungatella hathewayi DSM 13479 TaxID=566550 RepID=D3AAJ5_9FIRM|nr:hypothetical protein CLOSTHATH_00617 [Hungatella hathewayi DSM 13479]